MTASDSRRGSQVIGEGTQTRFDRRGVPGQIHRVDYQCDTCLPDRVPLRLVKRPPRVDEVTGVQPEAQAVRDELVGVRVGEGAEKFASPFKALLKLIAQNTGRTEFELDTDAVASPDKVLSDWVVASYRAAPSDPAKPADESVA